MAITDKIRKAFDSCTVMAGVENDFECVYITKAAALLYLNEIDEAFQELAQTTAKCHADETETFECVCDGIGHYGKRLTVHVMECSACGRTYEHVNGDYEYCPHCGKRLEVSE